jgi:lipid-A-disaccharide synthase
MRPYVDRILCILPFEVKELERLAGPPGTYVGHRLRHDGNIEAAAAMQAAPRDLVADDRVKTLLLLPGSRGGEVRRLIEPFGRTVSILRARGHRLRLILPTVPHVADFVRGAVKNWDEAPEIFTDPADKWRAFGEADAALIASGTVSLELALAGVPMIATYKLDPVVQAAQRLITVWSALLPNIIADRAIVPEFYNGYVRPENLARQLEALFSDSGMRAWQKAGFAEVRRRMETDRPAGDMAAEAVLSLPQMKKRP